MTSKSLASAHHCSALEMESERGKINQSRWGEEGRGVIYIKSGLELAVIKPNQDCSCFKRSNGERVTRSLRYLVLGYLPISEMVWHNIYPVLQNNLATATKNLHSKISSRRLLRARKTGSSTKYSSSFSEREISWLSLQVLLRANLLIIMF